MQFQKATKKQAKLRFFLAGPSGSGKTWTALAMAQHLGKRVALIDTEHHSAEKYASDFEFDTLNLDDPKITAYEQSIIAGDKAGYDVVIVDSLTHAWLAAQQLLDDEAAKSKSGNNFNAWGKVTPVWNKLLRTIISTNCHVIGTCRSKVDYILETDQRGKQVPRKVGMAPIMREGAEYEFDVAAEMDLEHRMIIGKTRCPKLDGQVYVKPGKDVAEILLAWLSEGVEPEPPKEPAKVQTPEERAFIAWVRPLIDAKTVAATFVRQCVDESKEDYAAARVAIEKTLPKSERQPAGATA
jgi:hypothetical protein